MPLVAVEADIQNRDYPGFCKEIEREYEKMRCFLGRAEQRESSPPNKTSTDTAWKLVHDLSGRISMPISAVLPCAEGGVGICFAQGEKFADFQCFNDGSVYQSTWDVHGHVDVFYVVDSSILHPGKETELAIHLAITRLATFFEAC